MLTSYDKKEVCRALKFKPHPASLYDTPRQKLPQSFSPNPLSLLINTQLIMQPEEEAKVPPVEENKE